MKKMLLTILSLVTLGTSAQEWITTWATATELSNGTDNLPRTTTLSNCAVRQTVHVSIGGDAMRLKLSNTFSSKPVEIKSVYVGDGSYLTFGGRKSAIIKGGETITSDAVKYGLRPLQLLTVTINYGVVPEQEATGHRGSRTTTHIMKGESKPGKPFEVHEQIERWYSIDAIDVQVRGEKPRCIAVLGNSITDGRGSTTDMQNRWTDVLAEVFDGKVAVLNLGIGGNCILQGGLGPVGIERFDRDILGQQGVTDVVIFEGINDIGGSKNAERTSRQLIHNYEKFIDKCRQRGMKVYMGTITPLGNTGYWSYFHEAARQTVNDWIRGYDKLDGIIDFDECLRDPSKPTQMRAEWQFDWLHPNAEGYKAMGIYAAEKLR